MGERKDELLDAVIEYLIKNGVSDLSLRPLAHAIGTSARLLIFHFKSKEHLLEAALEKIQRQVRTSFDAVCAEETRSGQASLMSRFWQWASAPDQLPYLRLLYEVHVIAARHPRLYARYLHKMSIRWNAAIEAQLPVSVRTRALAVLCGAVFDGLMLELMTTGDIEGTTAAVDLFVDWMRTAGGLTQKKLVYTTTTKGLPRRARKSKHAKPT
jgi:AcrR family transcriptional regulator